MTQRVIPTTAPERTAPRGGSNRRPLLTFFALALGLTWSFLIAGILSRQA